MRWMEGFSAAATECADRLSKSVSAHEYTYAYSLYPQSRTQCPFLLTSLPNTHTHTHTVYNLPCLVPFLFFISIFGSKIEQLVGFGYTDTNTYQQYTWALGLKAMLRIYVYIYSILIDFQWWNQICPHHILTQALTSLLEDGCQDTACNLAPLKASIHFQCAMFFGTVHVWVRDCQ